MTLYWLHVHTRIPLTFVHRAELSHLWDENRLPPLLLASMCAHAAPFASHPAVRQLSHTDPKGVANAFARWGKKLVARATDEEPTLHHITALLLLGKHAGAVGEASTQWTYSGLAIRMAFFLHLDKDPVTLPNLTAIERDHRRRLWWSCFIVDRGYATHANRPLMIPQSHGPARMPYPGPETLWLSNDERGLTDWEQKGFLPDPLSPFVQIARLFFILGEVYKWQEEQKLNTERPRDVKLTDPVLEDFNTSLDSYVSSLPRCFRVEVHNFPPEITKNLSPVTAAFVALQHSTARVLLHRPSAMLSFPNPSPHLTNVIKGVTDAGRALEWLRKVTKSTDMRDPDP
ncbi:hypothetical protein HK097_006715, partial [Rhizophlyctis rosea]